NGHLPTANGFFAQNGGLAIDDNSGSPVLYFTTELGNGSSSSADSEGGIFKYNLTNNSTGTFSTVFQQTTAQPNSLLTSLTLDPAQGKYYVTDIGGGLNNSSQGIWVGQLSGGAPIKFLQVSDAQGLGPSQITVDNAPTLSVTSTSPTFTESASNPASTNNTPVSLISASTAFDSDSFGLLASATIAISGSFVGSGDSLFVLDGATHLTSGIFTGTNITVSETTDASGNQTLTLTGADTFADYQAALNAVRFTNTSENPTDYGTHLTRTLT